MNEKSPNASLVREFTKWQKDFDDWRQQVLAEYDKFEKKQDALREMINWTTANAMGCRIVATAVLAGVPLTDDRVSLLLDALAPSERDPSGQFRKIARNVIDDVATVAQMWSAEKITGLVGQTLKTILDTASFHRQLVMFKIDQIETQSVAATR